MTWSHNKLVIARVKEGNPREIYSGLLWWQKHHNFKFGWIAMKFREIFGKWPRPQTAVEPVAPNQDLREYLGIMKNRWKQKQKREAKRHDDGCACWICIARLQRSVISRSDFDDVQFDDEARIDN